jgi:Thiol-disulfide isomerase and thioredoxins
MKKIVVFFVFLITIGISSCSQQNRLEPKRTVIAGAVSNFSEDAHLLIVNYCNPLGDEYRFTQDLIESNGYFRTEQEYVFAQHITIRFANRFINLFIHPGDSVFVNIDARKIQNDVNHAVVFSGNNQELNEELNLWINYSSSIHNQNRPKFDLQAPPQEFLASIKQNFEKAQDSIMAYSKRTNMSDFLKKWAYIEHKFMIANGIMDYKHPEANLWDVFTDPIFDVFNEDNFQSMYFEIHAGVCFNKLLQTDAEISRLMSEKDYISAIRLSIERLSEKAPKGVVRDYMLYKFLKNALEEIPDLYDSIPGIKTTFSQSFFNSELEKRSEKNRKIEQSLKVSDAEKQLDGILYMTENGTEELQSVKLLNHLTEKYKDKVLYIDVWATWCGPCMHEFKFTPDLHKYFKDKDVVFINLCLASDIGTWKPAIMRNNIEGENYFLGNDATELFRTENNLPGYPSYLLIDKSGEIHNPVPRPSNLESTIETIESHLD